MQCRQISEKNIRAIQNWSLTASDQKVDQDVDVLFRWHAVVDAGFPHKECEEVVAQRVHLLQLLESHVEAVLVRASPRQHH